MDHLHPGSIAHWVRVKVHDSKITEENVLYFNAAIFLENKSQVGKIYEIFGTLMPRTAS